MQPRLGPDAAASVPAHLLNRPEDAMSLGRLVILLLFVGCQRAEETPPLRPADVDPSPPSPFTQTIGEKPIITTTGSPRPYQNERLKFESVVIRNARINVRSALPVMSTAFRVRNEDSQAHEIAIRVVGGEPLVPPALVSPDSSMITEVMLSRGLEYEIVCVLPGHSEAARFKTYVPR